jgi:uncharacterized protein (DUF2384 family)
MADSATEGYLPQLEAVLEVVYIYFGGDRDKVNAWLRTPNEQVEGRLPIDLIRHRETGKLFELAQGLLKEMDKT